MINKVHTRFSKAALSYDTHALAQHEAGAYLISQLPDQAYHRLLDLGCGTGYTTRKLIHVIKPKYSEALDFSSDLLAQAKVQLANYPTHFIEADFDLSLSEYKPDLIFSNMALHWSNNLENLIQRIYHALPPNGIFAFSLPLTHTFHEIQSIATIKEFLDADTICQWLNKTNFQLLHQSIQRHITQHDNLKVALRCIQKTGANTTHKHHPSFLKRSLLTNQPQTLTYECGYFIARKPNVNT